MFSDSSWGPPPLFGWRLSGPRSVQVEAVDLGDPSGAVVPQPGGKGKECGPLSSTVGGVVACDDDVVTSVS